MDGGRDDRAAIVRLAQVQRLRQELARAHAEPSGRNRFWIEALAAELDRLAAAWFYAWPDDVEPGARPGQDDAAHPANPSTREDSS